MSTNLVRAFYENPVEGYDAVVDPANDGMSSNGWFPQNSTSSDQAAGVERDGSGNLTFKDAVLGTTKTLTQLAASASPLTTKGDLFGFSTVNARVPVGTNALPLVANSAVTLGVEYAILTVPGGGTGVATLASNGVLYGNGSGVVQVTAQGGTRTILTANGGSPVFSAAPILNTSIQLGVESSTTGALKLAHASSAFLTTIQAGNAAAARTYTWPTNFGSAGQVLTDAAGNGTLSWAGTTVTPAALTKTDDTNVTLTLGGTPSTALLQATSLTLGWSGNLSVARGGSGVGTFTTNGVLYGNSTTSILVTAQGGTNTILTASAGAPSWSAAPIINNSIQLGVASSTTGSILFGHASSSFLTTIQSGNATAASTYTLPVAAPSSTKFLQSTSGGVLSWVASVGTASVAFTDKDTARRVTITDSNVTASSNIIMTVQRPDTSDPKLDPGYVYIPNVIYRTAGSFDVWITALDWGGADTTNTPPNETITLNYMLS